MKKISILTVAYFLVLGCFFNSSAQAADKANFSQKAKLSVEFKFMPDLLKSLKADGLNCQGYKKNTAGVIGVREEGTCKFNNEELTIDIFPDKKTATTIVTSLKSFGGYFIGLSNWTIYLSDGATAKMIIDGLKLKNY